MCAFRSTFRTVKGKASKTDLTTSPEVILHLVSAPGEELDPTSKSGVEGETWHLHSV